MRTKEEMLVDLVFVGVPHREPEATVETENAGGRDRPYHLGTLNGDRRYLVVFAITNATRYLWQTCGIFRSSERLGAVDYPDTIRPGQSAEVHVWLESPNAGRVRESLTLTSANSLHMDILLPVEAVIEAEYPTLVAV